VQSRWDYFNREHNALTRGMALLMDGHFVLEQVTRSRGGYAFNFNGTGGIWRRQAIEAAGGWEDDTICEDTDLSYRAFLVGYRGVYLKDVACPSELPVHVLDLKSQQHRWAKGLTECLLKLLPRVWAAPIPLRQKVEATFHLGANLAFPASLFLTVLALPVLLLRMGGMKAGPVAQTVDLVAFSLVIVTQVLFYVVSTREAHKDWRRRLTSLPFPMLVGVGLAVNNARGVMEALTRLKTEFVRTPKLGVATGDVTTERQRARTYASRSVLAQGLIEVGLGVMYLGMALVQLRTMPVGSLVTAFFSLGLFLMGAATLKRLWAQRAAQAGAVRPAPGLPAALAPASAGTPAPRSPVGA